MNSSSLNSSYEKLDLNQIRKIQNIKDIFE